jgi:CRISPR-associated endoribonuclease Cas6
MAVNAPLQQSNAADPNGDRRTTEFKKNSMRLHLQIRADGAIIPYAHQKLLTGTIHKWLGQNELHGNTGLFSFSRLAGAKNVNETGKTKGGLRLSDHTAFFISAHNEDIIRCLVQGIMQDRSMFYGLEVDTATIQEDPDLSARDYFLTASPILLKLTNDNGTTTHYRYTDEISNSLLKENLQSKMKIAGMEPDDTLDIRFDTQNPKASTKLVDYGGIQNRANWCPVIINAKPETKLFAWNSGLGNSTGVGFGAII